MAFSTKLEAVNLCLDSIGERPVSSIEESSRLDVVRAVNVIDEVSRLVQVRGWWFNTEPEFVLTPTSPGGVYNVSNNVLKVDVTRGKEDNTYKFVFRNGKLYDVKSRTDSGFTDDLTVDLVVLVDYDELPEEAKLYISRRAAVTFQARTVGSTTLSRITEREAQEAWAELLKAEIDAEDLSLLTSPGVMEAVYER